MPLKMVPNDRWRNKPSITVAPWFLMTDSWPCRSAPILLCLLQLINLCGTNS